MSAIWPLPLHAWRPDRRAISPTTPIHAVPSNPVIAHHDGDRDTHHRATLLHQPRRNPHIATRHVPNPDSAPRRHCLTSLHRTGARHVRHTLQHKPMTAQIRQQRLQVCPPSLDSISPSGNGRGPFPNTPTPHLLEYYNPHLVEYTQIEYSVNHQVTEVNAVGDKYAHKSV